MNISRQILVRSTWLCRSVYSQNFPKQLSTFKCLTTGDKDLYIHPHTMSYQAVFVRGMAKVKGKSKGGKGGKKVTMDDLIDELSDDEDEEIQENEEEAFFRETPLSTFVKSQKSGAGKGKTAKGSQLTLNYKEIMEVVDGEKLWGDLDKVVEDLKENYIQQFNVRSSTSLDQLPVELEGDSYPLNEIAAISKKDPKRLIIDVSSFPQAAQNVMKSIRDSGMNLNPQQDGLRIFVPIPKVTKEFREKLSAGARKKLVECKDDLRKVQNRYIKFVGEEELSEKVTKDKARGSSDLIKLVTNNFIAKADQLFVIKSKEILG